MGWDVTQVGKNITTKKFLEFDIKRDYPHLELVKLVEGKNEYGQKPFFAAFKRGDKVTGAVFLTRRKNGSLAVKVIGEEAGPMQLAPASFIKLLTPTDNAWANQWRQRSLDVELLTQVG